MNSDRRPDLLLILSFIFSLALVSGCGPTPADKPDTGDDDSTQGAIAPIDLDGDGYGPADEGGGDCDDSDDTIHPGATESCDEIDNDCDGQVDTGAVDAGHFYRDADEDGFGDQGDTVEGCEMPSGYVEDDTDCDDLAPGNFPGNSEACDGQDNNCDGGADEGVTTRYYADTDGDGFGDQAAPSDACQLPAGYAVDGTDCDDGDARNYPGGAEVCDQRDNDCDGLADELLPTTLYHADSDGDGFGSTAVATQACATPAGYIVDGTDCDDADAGNFPDNQEVCDGRDNNCTGIADDGASCPCPLKYYGGRPYLFCTKGLSWPDARTQCHAIGYHLLTLNDPAENSWAGSTADIYSTSFWWTGLNDLEQEGTFAWEDGTPVDYTYWTEGEPNNYQDNEDCVELHLGSSGRQWNDEACQTAISYVCEAY